MERTAITILEGLIEELAKLERNSEDTREIRHSRGQASSYYQGEAGAFGIALSKLRLQLAIERALEDKGDEELERLVRCDRELYYLRNAVEEVAEEEIPDGLEGEALEGWIYRRMDAGKAARRTWEDKLTELEGQRNRLTEAVHASHAREDKLKTQLANREKDLKLSKQCEDSLAESTNARRLAMISAQSKIDAAVGLLWEGDRLKALEKLDLAFDALERGQGGNPEKWEIRSPRDHGPKLKTGSELSAWLKDREVVLDHGVSALKLVEAIRENGSKARVVIVQDGEVVVRRFALDLLLMLEPPEVPAGEVDEPRKRATVSFEMLEHVRDALDLAKRIQGRARIAAQVSQAPNDIEHKNEADAVVDFLKMFVRATPVTDLEDSIRCLDATDQSQAEWSAENFHALGERVEALEKQTVVAGISEVRAVDDRLQRIERVHGSADAFREHFGVHSKGHVDQKIGEAEARLRALESRADHAESRLDRHSEQIRTDLERVDAHESELKARREDLKSIHDRLKGFDYEGGVEDRLKVLETNVEGFRTDAEASYREFQALCGELEVESHPDQSLTINRLDGIDSRLDSQAKTDDALDKAIDRIEEALAMVKGTSQSAKLDGLASGLDGLRKSFGDEAVELGGRILELRHCLGLEKDNRSGHSPKIDRLSERLESVEDRCTDQERQRVGLDQRLRALEPVEVEESSIGTVDGSGSNL